MWARRATATVFKFFRRKKMCETNKNETMRYNICKYVSKENDEESALWSLFGTGKSWK